MAGDVAAFLLEHGTRRVGLWENPGPRYFAAWAVAMLAPAGRCWRCVVGRCRRAAHARPLVEVADYCARAA